MTVPYAYQNNVEFAELLRGDVYPDGTVIPTSKRIGIKFDGNAVSVYEFDASTGVRVRKKIYDSAPGEFVPDEDEATCDLAKRLECMQNEIDELEEEEWDIRRRISELESESWKCEPYASSPVPVTPESEKAEAEHAAKVAERNEQQRIVREEAERESKWCEENRQRIIDHITSWATAKVWELDGEQVRRFVKELECNEYMPEITAMKKVTV